MSNQKGQGAFVSGFSKKTKAEKLDWISQQFHNPSQALEVLHNYNHSDQALQTLHDEFIENALTNFYMPLGVAPNFIINGKTLTIPMAIEESSVVAAASNAAKFWSTKGGFKATIIGTEKVGHVHFMYHGDVQKLNRFFEQYRAVLLASTDEITHNMRSRGGGITALSLVDKSDAISDYYQLDVRFETQDAMGANFINSCLEQLGTTLKALAAKHPDFSEKEKAIEVVMSILSNYVPNCMVEAAVSCPVNELLASPEDSRLFAE